MRPHLVALVFAFGVLAAACSGGGTGPANLLPGSNLSPGSPRTGNATLSLKIPAQSRSGSVKRPAYISPNTQSVQITVQPIASPPAGPSAAPQTFPIATPSPCSQNPDGSKTCTFNVQAPLGEDQFTIATYAVASPGPNDIPLGDFETGAIDVAAGSTPPPINVTLSGYVASVDLTMESPDPGIPTSTQLQTVGTAFTTPNVLSITPLDASGSAILTDTFTSPITVTISPTNAGASLSLTGSQCSPASSSTGATVTITCAKDLDKVAYTYDGTIARDASKNVVDRVTFSAQPQLSSSPQPAALALTGTVIPASLPVTIVNPYPLQFVPRGDGTFYFLAGSNPNSVFGTFDPSNPSASQNATLPFVAAGIALDQSGNIWIGVNNDGSGNSLQCFTSVTANPANAISLPWGMAPSALTTDGNGNVWYYGMNSNPTSYAGYFTPGSACATSGPMPNPIQFGTISDYPEAAVPVPSSIDPTAVYLLSNSNANIYEVNESEAGNTINTPTVTPPGSYFGQALAIDGAGNLYGTFPPNALLAPIIAQLSAGGTMYTASLEPNATVGGLGVYPSTGAATLLAYADGSGLATLDLAPNFATSNLQIFPIQTASYATVFFDSNGDPWTAYADSSQVLSVAHLVRTSVWSIVNTSLSVPNAGGVVNIAISETGDSGPFKIATSDPTVATPVTQYTGIDHLLPLQFSNNGSSVTVTVTDNHGRSETKTLSVNRYTPGARRRSSAKIPFRPAPHH